MRKQTQPSAPNEQNVWQKVFPLFVGLWMAVVFVKFGNPVIFEDLIDTPRTPLEFALNSWPLSWACLMLGIVVLFGMAVMKWSGAAPKWILILPLVWFGWQLISARQTVNGALTVKTLLDFGGCTVCFYLGYFSLSHLRNRFPLWCGLFLGLMFCLWVGLGQHFGGLEQTRRYLQSINWELYPPQIKARFMSPEFQQKVISDRIFGTFIYPNALAGGIILVLPVVLTGLWNLLGRFSFMIRGVLVGSVAYIGLACLFWSGSKAGWLIMLAMMIVALLRLGRSATVLALLGAAPAAEQRNQGREDAARLDKFGRRLKRIVVVAVLLAGLGGFYGKYFGYFSKKNNSAIARADYWQAAWKMIKEKPLFGSGPGTFMVGYKHLKRPEAESTKLAHNDYLQQGSDSGVIGFCSYVSFIAGSVILLYRRLRQNEDPIPFAVWLGVAGLAAQELVEFSLYIPALAWPFFLFLGWLWGSQPDHSIGMSLHENRAASSHRSAARP